MKPHGLRGEVVVALVTNRLERLEPGAVLTVRRGSRPAAPADDGGEELPDRLAITGARPHGRRHLVRFAGVDDIDAAERLRGLVLCAPPIEDPDALFVHELIGATLVDTAGRPHGTVTAVEANPASDLLVLDGGELVPLVFVVGRAPGRVVVDPPEGLFE